MPEFNLNLDQLLKIYQLTSELYLRIQEQRATARALAATAGVSDADLDAADARFARRYFENPDAVPTEPPFLPSDDPTTAVFTYLTDAITAAQNANPNYGTLGVCKVGDTEFKLWPVSLGGAPGPFVWRP